MKKCHAYITCELGDFSSVLKLWSLTEIDAVTFGVLQVLLILHLLENIDNYSSCLLTLFILKKTFFVVDELSELILRGTMLCAKYKVLATHQSPPPTLQPSILNMLL